MDVGGASHEVSLVSVDQGLFRLLASSFSSESGSGEYFTKVLLEHCVKALHRQHPESKAQMPLSVRSKQRLLHACEAAKRTLSQQNRAQIAVDSLMDGIDFSIKISRSRFEELIEPAIKVIVADIGVCLDRAGGYDRDDVDQVFLVGGCAHIPLLQRCVESYFGGKKVVLGADPDEVIATGATIEAGCLMDMGDELRMMKPDDDEISIPCVPLSLGIAAQDGSMVHIINREEVLPTSVHTEFVTTSVDSQDQIFIQVYEGERLLARDNMLLGEFCFGGLPSTAEAGQVQIQVSFQVNRKKELQIVAMEIESGKSVNWTIPQANPPRLNKEQVQALVDEAEAKAEEDEAALDALEECREDDHVEETAASVPTDAASGDADMD